MSSVRRAHRRARHHAMPKVARSFVRVSCDDATHVDDWLDVPPPTITEGEAAARAWLALTRLPAIDPRKHIEPGFRVTCAYRGRRYWLSRGSNMGDVALRQTPPAAIVGPYHLRVWIDELSDFARHTLDEARRLDRINRGRA